MGGFKKALQQTIVARQSFTIGWAVTEDPSVHVG